MVLSTSWKKKAMNAFIRSIEQAGVLRYDKRRARVVVNVREGSND